MKTNIIILKAYVDVSEWLLITHSIHQVDQPTMRFLKEKIVFGRIFFFFKYCNLRIAEPM